MGIQNREAWLTDAIDNLTGMFKREGIDVPPVRVSVGWPGGRGKKSSTIGQCWGSAASADAIPQVFISPVLHEARGPQGVLATLAHEMIHAIDDCNSGHRGAFARMAKRIGLEGPMTATHAGEALSAELDLIAEALGEYPHAALTPGVAAVKKQKTRMLKVTCLDSGYTVRTTRKWIDEVGTPLCPCHENPMEEETVE